MGSFILKQKARDDLLAIGRYTRKKWGKTQQIRYLTQFDRAFHDLADKPDLGRSCEVIREGYFKYGVGKHVIFYRQTGKGQVEIVRILHGRIDIEQHL
ncbi:type II toxin-antitoxin system RelE/ParE family toxin [Nitrosomonas sp.]|uniref:type II toxin-antitoxin system RelE/ParE family toxin n=1 Tax=Nitrosomonas sp. TaxID=42353 RepID=UPI00261F7DDE|nr:type II toxin-antitoxin system RelE/ParE family toxin [Nitrosomonas sp.]MCW5600897.1 type II toxin-antitoxin system RelE/ParE family toxin [Nitrosomonas sp.]